VALWQLAGGQKLTYHTLPHFETEAWMLLVAFSCLLLPSVAAAAAAWETHLPLVSVRHSTCICIFELRFVCGLPLGCVYTRIAAVEDVPDFLLHLLLLLLSLSLFLSLNVSFRCLALNLYANLHFLPLTCVPQWVTQDICIYQQLPQKKKEDFQTRLAWLA